MLDNATAFKFYFLILFNIAIFFIFTLQFMVTLEQMLLSGVHLGHSVKQMNPKMSSYIFGQRNGVHIIDLLQTLVCLQNVNLFLKRLRRDNKSCGFTS